MSGLKKVWQCENCQRVFQEELRGVTHALFCEPVEKYKKVNDDLIPLLDMALHGKDLEAHEYKNMEVFLEDAKHFAGELLNKLHEGEADA